MYCTYLRYLTSLRRHQARQGNGEVVFGCWSGIKHGRWLKEGVDFVKLFCTSFRIYSKSIASLASLAGKEGELELEPSRKGVEPLSASMEEAIHPRPNTHPPAQAHPHHPSFHPVLTNVLTHSQTFMFLLLQNFDPIPRNPNSSHA